MTTSIFLAQLFGCYLVIISMAMILRPQRILIMAKTIIENPGLLGFIAIIQVIFGLLILLSHWLWVMDWPVLITILGTLVLLKGLMNLFCVDAASKLLKYFQTRRSLLIAAIINLLLGVFLLYHGFGVA